jgi:hypothetical protein
METIEFKKKINDLLFEEKEVIYEPIKGKSGGLSIKKNTRFNSYTFTGPTSKNRAKMFIFNTPQFKILAQIQNKKGFRQFIPFKSWIEALDLYKYEAYDHRYLYEVILSEKPCKPYLDVEWKEENVNKKNYKIFLDKLTNDLINIFKTRYNHIIDISNILISSAHSNEKVSFHVVINCIFNNNYLVYKTNRKDEEGSAWDLYKALVESDSDYKNKIDESVFSLDREMRALYSTKFGQLRPFIPLYWEYEKENKFCDNMVDYFITHFNKNTEFTYLKTPVCINTKKEYIKNITNINQIKGNHLTDHEEKNIIIRVKEMLQDLHPTAYYSGRTSDNYGFRFSYNDRTESCYTGHTHKNNGFCIYIKQATGDVFMYCHSTKCQKIYKLGVIHRDTNWNVNAIRIKEQFLNYKYKDTGYQISNDVDFIISKLDENEKINGFMNKLVDFGGTYCIKSPMGLVKHNY